MYIIKTKGVYSSSSGSCCHCVVVVVAVVVVVVVALVVVVVGSSRSVGGGGAGGGSGCSGGGGGCSTKWSFKGVITEGCVFLINLVCSEFDIFRCGWVGWEKNIKMTFQVAMWI